MNDETKSNDCAFPMLDNDELAILEDYRAEGKLEPNFFPLIAYDLVQRGYPMPNCGVMVPRVYGGTNTQGQLLSSNGAWCRIEDVKALLDAACAAPASGDTRPLYERIAPATERFGELFHQSLCESEPIDVTEDGLSEEAIRNITQIAERAFECYHELTNMEPPFTAPTDAGETAAFTLNAEEREVVEHAIDAYMSSHTRLVQDGVIVTLDKRLVAAKNDETTSPEVEPDKDYADRIHRPVK